MRSIRTVVAEDEVMSRRKLCDLVESTDGMELVGDAATGPDAVKLIDDKRPDLAFLDIEMPGCSGIDVVHRVVHRPHFVFTTAFDSYAVTAFELRALDYLLKPFGAARFQQTVERVRESMSSDESLDDRLDAWTVDGALERVFVRHGGMIVPVAMKDVRLFEARGDYVALHVNARRHLVHVSLNELERRLDSSRFMRIHRSYIVNLDFVESLRPFDGSRFEVVLGEGQTVVASRTKSKELRRLTL